LRSQRQSSAPPRAPIYKDASQAGRARVEDLLSRMTLEEKVAQLDHRLGAEGQDPDGRRDLLARKSVAGFPERHRPDCSPSDKRGVTSVERELPALLRRGANRDARDTAEYVNAAQRWAVEKTRLGIPILMHEEALHGYVARGATSFPQSIALASTWDPGLGRARLCGCGARDAGARHDAGARSGGRRRRDPRWGRIEETYGEDPYLVSEMGLAAIRGFQGTTLPLAPDKVMVTLKHMTGHGQPENGTNVGPAQIGERTLRRISFRRSSAR
jgi:beta-glucosidase